MQEGDHYHRRLGLFGIRQDAQAYERPTWDAVLADLASVVFVAVYDDCVIGFARAGSADQAGGHIRADRRYVMVREMVVAEASRGQGVGKALLGAVKDWASARSIESVELNVFADNADARAFYRREGFIEHRLHLRCDVKSVASGGSKT